MTEVISIQVESDLERLEHQHVSGRHVWQSEDGERKNEEIEREWREARGVGGRTVGTVRCQSAFNVLERNICLF